MRVFVNDMELTLAAGMTVRHALTALNGAVLDEANWLVQDQWGNRLGLDGTLQADERITASRLRQTLQQEDRAL
jgi:hypothetical protein